MRTNAIRTYAGFWPRVRAFALDYLIILLYLATITLLIFLLNFFFHLNDLLFTDRFRAQIIAFLLVTLPVTLYFAISEASLQQATWGKKRLGLRVVDDNERRISFGRSFVRTMLKFIPWELSHTLIWTLSFSPQSDSIYINYGFGLVYGLVGLNIASLIMTKKQQTVYDLIMKTYVVKQAP